MGAQHTPISFLRQVYVGDIMKEQRLPAQRIMLQNTSGIIKYEEKIIFTKSQSWLQV